MPESKRLYPENTSRLESLIEIAQILEQERDFDHVLKIISEKACILFSADFGRYLISEHLIIQYIRLSFMQFR